MKDQHDPACFFDDGIRFECQQCGACCTGDPGTIYVSAEEIKKIAAHNKRPIKRFVKEYLYPFKDSYSIREHGDGRCYFFETGRGCTIYAVRPQQCRTFPFWFSNLRNEAYWQVIANGCPGIGKGRCFSKGEIIEQINSF
ncbi:MAG: hypothetical protein ACD_62C00083G0022 [uncultured bacterium]|nr:MAG: hypothetical protein ACD_62C00083G0022 [uncultured bacterium]HLD44394.1 YkgJ family cysteine cluster protein [bacterium]